MNNNRDSRLLTNTVISVIVSIEQLQVFKMLLSIDERDERPIYQQLISQLMGFPAFALRLLASDPGLFVSDRRLHRGKFIQLSLSQLENFVDAFAWCPKHIVNVFDDLVQRCDQAGALILEFLFAVVHHFDQVTDLVNTNPSLGPLQDNGGPTFTHALLEGSPAIDAGSCTDVDGNTVHTDQRGMPRPQGANCDIGAFELSERLWIAKDGGDWSDPANWFPSDGAPGPSDEVLLSSTAPLSITLDEDITLAGLVLSGPGVSLTQGSHNLTVNGDLVQSAGTLAVGGDQLNVSGTLALLGGTFNADVDTITVGGDVTHAGGDFIGSGGTMHIDAMTESTQQVLVLRRVRHDA